jgi:3-oxoacid CoA-transferase B subunit
MAEQQPLTREQIAAVIARYLEPGWMVNLGVGMPMMVSNFVFPEQDIMFSSENGLIGYSGAAPEGKEDWDTVNAGGRPMTIVPGATAVHHADSFAMIRRGLIDVTVLGAYEVALDGSFANWKTNNDEFSNLGGIGGAMDLAACAQQVWVTMDHTTRDGQPRLLEHCQLPVTAPSGATLVVTDRAVVAVRDGRFELLEHAPGFSVEEIQAATGAPLAISPDLHQIVV